MPEPDEAAEVTRRRLAALDLQPRGWVPDQTGYAFPAGAADPPPTSAPPPALPAPAPAPAPASGPGALARLPRPAWLDTIELAGSPRALLGLAALCVCCLLVTGWALLRAHNAPSTVDVPPPVPAAPPATLATPSPAGIVVDVGGRVRRPGLVTLPPGARVADAIRAAGGAVRSRDLTMVDLAAKVSDGQLLLIGVPGAAPTDGGTAGAGAPVNLNTATVDALDTLPGIGPVLAQRIIDWRSAHGGFRTVRDLDQVSGIGDSIYAEVAPLVTV